MRVFIITIFFLFALICAIYPVAAQRPDCAAEASKFYKEGTAKFALFVRICDRYVPGMKNTTDLMKKAEREEKSRTRV
jgi:hypothetical protein